MSSYYKNVITGCTWEDGIGTAPDGEICGECSFIKEHSCPQLEKKKAITKIEEDLCGYYSPENIYEAGYIKPIKCGKCKYLDTKDCPRSSWQGQIGKFVSYVDMEKDFCSKPMRED